MLPSVAKSNALAGFMLLRCCVLVAYWLASSAPVSGLRDVIDYRIVEGQSGGKLIGNIPVDAGLHTIYTAQTLTSFRYQILPTDGAGEQGDAAMMRR